MVQPKRIFHRVGTAKLFAPGKFNGEKSVTSCRSSWPGMGLMPSLYLSTPDGHEGWATSFAKAGHPVYVIDGPQNLVTGVEMWSFADASRPPRMMLWANEITWDRWGIGESPGVPLKETRFPTEHIDQLHASMTPVIGEGMGGSSGFAATRLKPDLVKAIVAVEVVGSPTDVEDVKKHFADKQLIGVYGDNFEMRRMQGRYGATVEMAKLISDAGGSQEKCSPVYNAAAEVRETGDRGATRPGADTRFLSLPSVIDDP